jgi:c-di-GMP-binding flagellar brake protein YcgR
LIPFFFFAAVLLVCGYFFTRSKNEGPGNWIQFYSKGKEAGFTIRDLDQLRRLIAACKIADPVSIFKSQKHLETVIRSVINSVRMAGELNEPSTQEFLSRLFDYCIKLGLETAEVKSRITNSRQISEGQALRILVPGTGVYKSEVVKNFGNYLTISRPVNSKVSSTMQWSGLRISVYFWREDDAGYVFDTEVIDEVFSKGISSLKVEHNDSLFRTQKRKSLRVKYNKAAFLYIVRDMDNPHSLEKYAGLRVMMDDISDTGCAFRVNGQASIGLRFKVQFSIDKIPVCIPGIVRSVDYNQESNISLVHMEADTLPIGTRNHILCQVFDLLPEEDDDELPFRILEEEVGVSAGAKTAEPPGKLEAAEEVMDE